MIHATHCGGAHRVITHSTLVGSGSAISNCRRLPALHGAPCHCTFEPWISENPGQRLQLENTFQATSHWALVKIVWLMRAESDCDFGTGTCRERPFSGLDGLRIVEERPFLNFESQALGELLCAAPGAVVSLIHSSSNPSLHWKIWGEGLTLKR